MKALFIGGTGTISTAIVQRLVSLGWEVWLLNRGNRTSVVPEGVHVLKADIHREGEVISQIGKQVFDVIADFIGFTVSDVERDYRLFQGRCRQYIYISSASAYHKPAADYRITEGTALSNPYWEYSRNKIACEQYLMERHQQDGFPATIVRPSHTYDCRSIPVGIHGNHGSWQVMERMLRGKPVLIHGDGSSLWTLTYNTDFAIGFTGLMGNPHAIGEAFQITGDETLTWNQIYATIADALDVELNPYYVSSSYLADVGRAAGYDFAGSLLGDKAVSVVFDNAKLKRIVPEMRTNVPFSEGVRKALQYILAHPAECQHTDPPFDRFCDQVIAAQEASKKLIV